MDRLDRCSDEQVNELRAYFRVRQWEQTEYDKAQRHKDAAAKARRRR